MKHTKEPEVFWIGGDYDSQGRTTEPIDADDNWIKVISYEAYQEIKEKLEAYSEESMKARGLMIVGEDYRDGEVRELKENLARFENPIFDYVNVEANLVYDSPGLLHIAAALVDDHRRLKEECEDLRKKLLTATGAKSIQQKMHEAAKEAWEKENARLREALEKIWEKLGYVGGLFARSNIKEYKEAWDICTIAREALNKKDEE